MKTSLIALTVTRAPRATIWVRLLVGAVFFEEGIQKFLFPDLMGAGRFNRIGIPHPEIMGPFVGSVEIVCGALILIGLLTRLAAIPLLINISVAIISTKIPILLGHDFLCFHVAKLARYGFWSMASEARTDFSMLLGLIFLTCVGAGKWSFDACWNRKSEEKI
ncbi:MAG TPA: DoxX family protein [Verrucomicrobiae bacterium]|nr:DoxX family protein [Verrucomicrobiae bacterium]